MLTATLAAADVGQSVVAALLGLGAAGVAGGIVAMAWSVHMHQIRLAERLAPPAKSALMGHGANGATGTSGVTGTNGANGSGTAARAANGNGVHQPPGYADEPPGYADERLVYADEPLGYLEQPARRQPAPAPGPPTAIEGPDSVVIGEQARYRVRRSGVQQVVAWAAGGGSVSQAADPAHPDDLLLVADRPGDLTVSVRLREGLTERRETKTVTAVAAPEPAAPPVMLRLFLQDWPLATVSVLVVGFAAALVALGSLGAGDFIALAAPLAALLGVIATSRASGGKGTTHADRSPPAR